MGDVRGLWIGGSAGRLEAALRTAQPPRAAAVVAHPHPQYGGTLHNPVVFHVDRELNRAGFATLRFNFRGAGTSEGAHDGGRGEIDDVAAATSWLRGVVPNVPLLVVGYSFGACCGLRYALTDSGVAAWVAIGLPVRLYSVEGIERFGRPLAVVQGSEDEFGSPHEVGRALERARPRAGLHVIDGVGHLFEGRGREVARRVVQAADECLARAH